MKKNRGITLIALVITIIVLLILAGVAISMLSGENGILKKAADAKTNTEEAKKEEAATLIDYDIESHFILNNSKYKCRNGFITGVTVGEVEIEEGKKELRTIDTVEDLQKALPDGYIVATKYTEEAKDDPVDKDENLKTGMAITKGAEEVARVVVYGDIRCNGILSINRTSGLAASWISKCVVGEKFPEFQKQAMNVIHDEYIDENDFKYISEYCSNLNEGEEFKKQNIYATKIKTPIKIPDVDTINSLDICNKDGVEKIYDEENEMYYYKVTLNKSYTYKELYEAIKAKVNHKVNHNDIQIRVGGKLIKENDENPVATGAEISINIPLIVNNNTIPESSNICLEVK